MAAVRQNLDIYQGETFSYVYTYGGGSPVNLTGYTARMAVKRDRRAEETSYLSTGDDADGGTITLGGAAGTVTVAMTAAQTQAMDETDWWFAMFGGEPDLPLDRSIEFFYDLEIVSGAGVVTRLLQGTITFHRGITSD